jgi:hypothetical protein
MNLRGKAEREREVESAGRRTHEAYSNGSDVELALPIPVESLLKSGTGASWETETSRGSSGSCTKQLTSGCTSST